ncbi:MAG TPA: hypothetical protein VES67_03165 [Vicinamibacterales bacterium]|nr:hypothetical protein [Vicinamibacterales bacterium]
MRRLTHHLFAVAVLLAEGIIVEAQRSGGQTTSPAVIAVLGQWDPGMEGTTPIVTADARKWNGKPAADLDGLGRRLFGATRPEFLANVTSEGAFPLAVIDGIQQFQAGTLHVDFKMIGGESDQIAGLVLNLQPTGDYLYVRYNTRDDNLALWRFTKGQREVIAHGTNHRRLVLNAWHPLSVTIKGRTISAVAAGDLRVEHMLDHDISGRVGLWTKRDSITSFRNWRLSANLFQ